MSTRVHRLPTFGPRLLTKQQLAQHLNRSPRWIELRVNEGMPSENLDRRGRRLFDLHAVEDWIANGQPVATSTGERLEHLEREMTRLHDRIRNLERSIG